MSKPEKSDVVALPMSVVTKLDVSRLVSEAERVDNELTTVEVQKKAGAQNQITHPVFSSQFEEFIAMNSLAFESSHERTAIIKQLRHLKDTVPVIHMTFATTADRASLEKLTEWIRAEIHPQAVIAVGLQPDLVGGVYLRTPNHVHDFSLRGVLKGKHDALVHELVSIAEKGSARV